MCPCSSFATNEAECQKPLLVSDEFLVPKLALPNVIQLDVVVFAFDKSFQQGHQSQ